MQLPLPPFMASPSAATALGASPRARPAQQQQQQQQQGGAVDPLSTPGRRLRAVRAPGAAHRKTRSDEIDWFAAGGAPEESSPLPPRASAGAGDAAAPPSGVVRRPSAFGSAGFVLSRLFGRASDDLCLKASSSVPAGAEGGAPERRSIPFAAELRQKFKVPPVTLPTPEELAEKFETDAREIGWTTGQFLQSTATKVVTKRRFSGTYSSHAQKRYLEHKRTERNKRELAFTLVPGSAEEERMFATMKFLKNVQRNRLLAEYLTAAARLFKAPKYLVDNFDFPKALKFWHDKKLRRTDAAKRRKAAEAANACAPSLGRHLTPYELNLALSNSMAEDDIVCAITVFCPIWIDNRTGFDLMFK
ncbi:hypothetical protein FOA52_001955 [Chlamydomonas sp. UWO 241]|nr:hypothetical protein FOA52_001955 [Chlamydomonas sp. UWO 241]